MPSFVEIRFDEISTKFLTFLGITFIFGLTCSLNKVNLKWPYLGHFLSDREILLAGALLIKCACPCQVSSKSVSTKCFG